MGLDFSAMFEGFDIMAIVTAIVDMITGLLSSFVG
jgi:hypothetical protein